MSNVFRAKIWAANNARSLSKASWDLCSTPSFQYHSPNRNANFRWEKGEKKEEKIFGLLRGRDVSPCQYIIVTKFRTN